MKSPLKKYLHDNYARISTDNAILSDQYYFEQVDDILYYYWSDRKNGRFDCSFDINFDIPAPIINKSSLEYQELDAKMDFPEFASEGIYPSFMVKRSEETGYVRPSYPFLDSIYDEYNLQKEAYEKTLELLGFKSESIISAQEVIVLNSFRTSLLTQLERQAEVVNSFNDEIASIFKVYFYELDKHDIPNDIISSPVYFFEIFFELDLLGGNYSSLIDLRTFEIHTKSEIVNHIVDTSVQGISALLKKRDKYISVAVKLSRTVDALEAIFEKAILGDRLLTPKEYLYKTTPDPFKIAYQMVSKAKNAEYSTETIGKAMVVVQEYIIEYEISSIWGKVQSVIELIKKREIPGIKSSTDDKTIRNWIDTYAKAAGISNSNPNLM